VENSRNCAQGQGGIVNPQHENIYPNTYEHQSTTSRDQSISSRRQSICLRDRENYIPGKKISANVKKYENNTPALASYFLNQTKFT
jgi:hypothetical protein